MNEHEKNDLILRLKQENEGLKVDLARAMKLISHLKDPKKKGGGNGSSKK